MPVLSRPSGHRLLPSETTGGWLLLRQLALALAGLCACVLSAGAMKTSAATTQGTWLREQIVGYQKLTWHWQDVMGVAATPRSSTRPSAQVLARWRRLAHAARVR